MEARIPISANLLLVVALTITITTCKPGPTPVQVNVFSPLPELPVGFEEQPVKVGVQVSDANNKPVTGVQVEAVITWPDGKPCAKGTLKETSEGVCLEE
jgi:hypothetical protein